MVMCLPVAQQRILHGMERQLSSSDPRLASLFGTFTRLTRDEDVPSLEELRAGPVARFLRSARLKTILFFPIALAAMACAVFIGGGGRGAQKCGLTLPLQRLSQVSPTGYCTWDLIQRRCLPDRAGRAAAPASCRPGPTALDWTR
jgi:hypothetical protein